MLSSALKLEPYSGVASPKIFLGAKCLILGE